MEHTPLQETLRPHLATRWDDLPLDLQELITQANILISHLWDDLNHDERAYILAQHDHEPTPYERLIIQQIIEEEDHLDKFETSKTQNDPERIKTKRDGIRDCNERLRQLEDELFKPGQQPEHGEIIDLVGLPSGKGNRINNLVRGICAHQSKKGKKPPARSVMAELKKMAGADPKPRNAEFLVGVTANGVKWKTQDGDTKEYDENACEQTIRRWQEQH